MNGWKKPISGPGSWELGVVSWEKEEGKSLILHLELLVPECFSHLHTNNSQLFPVAFIRLFTAAFHLFTDFFGLDPFMVLFHHFFFPLYLFIFLFS